MSEGWDDAVGGCPREGRQKTAAASTGSLSDRSKGEENISVQQLGVKMSVDVVAMGGTSGGYLLEVPPGFNKNKVLKIIIFIFSTKSVITNFHPKTNINNISFIYLFF